MKYKQRQEKKKKTIKHTQTKNEQKTNNYTKNKTTFLFGLKIAAHQQAHMNTYAKRH